MHFLGFMHHAPPRGFSILHFLIFTDLDDTLLDHENYSWAGAGPALEFCRERGVPVILATSKTRSEIEPLHGALSLSAPFISENGGGIFFPREICADTPFGTLPSSRFPSENKQEVVLSEDGRKRFWKISLGVNYDLLVENFRKIRHELGWNIRGFSDMDPAEISWLTGLDEEGARLASKREFDEPFILNGPYEDMAPLKEASGRKGLGITSGGRFFHLTGRNDKGIAMGLLISWYRRRYEKILTIALGDSPNDFGMLERSDFPVLIKSKKDYSWLKETIPGLTLTEEMGPIGWNTAVLHILKENQEECDVRHF